MNGPIQTSDTPADCSECQPSIGKQLASWMLRELGRIALANEYEGIEIKCRLCKRDLKIRAEITHQPNVFLFFEAPPDGWRRLSRFIDEDSYRWPGDSETGFKGNLKFPPPPDEPSIEFDEAVDLARQWLGDWKGSVSDEDMQGLRDWLVASFFTIAFRHHPLLVDGRHYRILDKDSFPFLAAPDEDVIEKCFDKAASRVHYEALRKAAALLLRWKGIPLGDALSGWVADYLEGLHPSRKRGRPAHKLARRNRAIVAVVKALEAHGIPPTRNEASPRESGCDAIDKATRGRVTYRMAAAVVNKHASRHHPHRRGLRTNRTRKAQSRRRR